MTKVCTKCLTQKPLEGFYKQKHGANGVGSRCKVCCNSWRREYGKQNKEKETQNARNWRAKNPKRHLNNVLTLKFGITADQYETMFKKQNGACAICKEQSLDGKRLCVDHDHNSGKVRGLLCDRCNRGIGFLKDSLENLRNAFDYLEDNKSIIRS